MTRWHIYEYYDYLNSAACTHAACERFAREELLQRIHMSVLCHGNTDEQGALRLVETTAKALGSTPLRRSQRPTPRLLRLPDDVEVVLRLHAGALEPSQLLLANGEETNSAIELTLQADLIALLDERLEEELPREDEEREAKGSRDDHHKDHYKELHPARRARIKQIEEKDRQIAEKDRQIRELLHGA